MPDLIAPTDGLLLVMLGFCAAAAIVMYWDAWKRRK